MRDCRIPTLVELLALFDRLAACGRLSDRCHASRHFHGKATKMRLRASLGLCSNEDSSVTMEPSSETLIISVRGLKLFLFESLFEASKRRHEIRTQSILCQSM